MACLALEGGPGSKVSTGKEKQAVHKNLGIDCSLPTGHAWGGGVGRYATVCF